MCEKNAEGLARAESGEGGGKWEGGEGGQEEGWMGRGGWHPGGG